MKKIKKRILSIVLTCAMMVSLLVGMAPMEVHAEDGATLTYEVVGGSGTMESKQLTVGEEFVLPAPSFIPDDGREFYGWFVYDSADDRELEVCGYEAPEFTPKGEYTYTAIACYGYPVTVKNLPEGTNITYMSTSISNPSALVIPEAGERISEEANCFIIQNSSMTSAPIFTGENGRAELVSSNDGEYYYVVRDITGPVTLVASSNPPATDTYTITLDRTNYADGYVELYTYNSEGNNVANTQDNNATIAMPEGGKVRVFADSEFTVTATGATVGEMQAAGEEGYYYELTGIAADTTVVVNKVTIPVVTAPIITGQPQNVSVQEGQKATFSVTATGDNLSYQWQIDRNDGNGFVNLSGATSASYITSTVDMDCNGFKYQCIVSNEGGSVTTNIATLTVTESTSVHTHSLTLVPAKVATCTETGNKAYYTCSGCDSLFADANGTTITTAEAVKIAALDHDWTGEWTIIKEATATEDGKKETLCTRGCGQKKVAIIPATGTTDDNSNLEKDAEVAPDAPIDEATLNNSKEELLEAGNIFTDAEKTQIANGTDARVWLEISKTDEGAIASTDKAKIEQEATQIMGDNLVITYFDADLFKQVGTQVGTNEKTPVPEPGIAIKITITIPDELLNSNGTVSREYQIIRLHDGQVDVINGTFDSATGEFTFESDKFSTYAIVYKDVPVNDDDENTTPGDDDDENENPTPSNKDVVNSAENKLDEVPKTGESNVTLYFFVLMLLSGAGVVICSRKKKTSNKES